MDGYAIRASEINEQGIFEVVCECPAGKAQSSIGAKFGTCAEIMTGAIVPADADCVVPYESTSQLDDRKIKLLEPKAHTSGDCIHTLGSDRSAGEVVFEAGVCIDSRHIAIAASCGYQELNVSKRPSIAIVSTGDELVDLSDKPEPHQIRRSNDLTVKSALLSAGFPSGESCHLLDEPQLCESELKRLSSENDILIISGGISMGKKDFIPKILTELGLECHFHGVAQKPGKPFGYWASSNCAVFALPGNPISTLSCLHQYVIPALYHASGRLDSPLPESLFLATDVKARDDITIFLPVKRGKNHLAVPKPINNSGDLVRIIDSDGYIALPPTDEKCYQKGKCFDFRPWY